MKIEDIPNVNTRKCVVNLDIDVEPFANYEELAVYLKLNRTRIYQQRNKPYYAAYNRKQYAKKRDGVVRKWTSKTRPEPEPEPVVLVQVEEP